MHTLIEKLKAKVARKSTATTLRGLMAAARRTNVVKVLPNGGVAWSGYAPRPPWYRRPIQAPQKMVVRKFTQRERDIRRAKNDVVFRRKFVAARRRRIAAMTPGEWFLPPIKTAKLAEELAPTNLGFTVAPKAWPEARALGAAAATYVIAHHQSCRDVGSSSYSGSVEYLRDFAPSGEGKAWTRTCAGDTYPGSWYKRTDATHCILFSYPEVERLMKIPQVVVDASTRDYAPIIGCLELHARSAKVRVVTRHLKKQQKDHVEWIAWQDDVVYHAATKEAAEKGLREKVVLMSGKRAAQARERTGVAPLFQFEVDIDTVHHLTGWCVRGCQRWVRTHLGRDTDRASWSEIAAAARKDTSAYGNTLLMLMGASRTPSSATWIQNNTCISRMQ